MEGPSVEHQQQQAGGKDLLQQALDLSALNEEECREDGEEQIDRMPEGETNQEMAQRDGEVSGGPSDEANTAAKECGNELENGTDDGNTLTEKQNSVNGVKESNDTSNGKTGLGNSEVVDCPKENENSITSKEEVRERKSSVESAEKKIPSNVPKIPSVVVRNENNDIIEQVNEPELVTPSGSASASIRQTLKSKIMEKSKSLEKAEKVRESQLDTTVSEGIHKVAGEETSVEKVSEVDREAAAKETVTPENNEGEEDSREGDFSQFNVKMPHPQPAGLNTAHKPQDGSSLPQGGSLVPQGGGMVPQGGGLLPQSGTQMSQQGNFNIQSGRYPANAMKNPALIGPRTDHLTSHVDYQQFQVQRMNDPSLRMRGVPHGIQNNLNQNPNQPIRGNVAPASIPVHQWDPRMQQMMPGFVPVRQFAPYSQEFIPYNRPRMGNPAGAVPQMISQSLVTMVTVQQPVPQPSRFSSPSAESSSLASTSQSTTDSIATTSVASSDDTTLNKQTDTSRVQTVTTDSTSATSSASIPSVVDTLQMPVQRVEEENKPRNCDSPLLNQFSYYKCDKCEYNTRLRQNFRKHYSVHLSYKPYSCKSCKFRTYGKGFMRNHMSAHPVTDQKDFYFFPDSALDKAIEFHCDDCKVVKWVNDAELASLKKEILNVQQKISHSLRKIKKVEEKEKKNELSKTKPSPGDMKRKLDDSGFEERGEVEMKVRKKPGRKPKPKNITPEKQTEKDADQDAKKLHEDVKKTHEHEESDTEDDEDSAKKKIPNYEIVDATNILETPKRKRKFKTLFDPSPELHQHRKHIPQATDDLEKSTTTPKSITTPKSTTTPQVKKVSKHKCPFCPYKTESPVGLRRHAFWRHNLCTYNCDDCSFKAKTKEEVLAHYEKEHPKMRPVVNRTIDKDVGGSVIETEEREDEEVEEEVQKEEGMEDGENEECGRGEQKENMEDQEETTLVGKKKHRGRGRKKREVHEKGEVSEDANDGEKEGENDEDENTENRESKHRKGKISPVKDKFLYKCTQCDFKSNVLGVQAHMLKRHNICRYLCGTCDFESTEEARVKEHFKSAHPTGEYAVFRGFVNLDVNNQKTNVTKKLKKTFQIKTLKKAKETFRFKQKKMQSSRKNTMAECPVCDFKSLYLGVQRHIYMFHGLAKWQCGRCGIELFDKATTIEHNLTVHQISNPSVIRSFVDVEKVKELKEQNALIVEKSGKIKIGAPGDGMVVSSPVKHPPSVSRSTSATPEKKEEFYRDTQCPECPFISNLKGVQRHLLMIHKICRWQCKICGFGSLDKYVTLEHSVDMHEGVDPKIVRAFVDIDRYNAEKRLNESADKDLEESMQAKKTPYVSDFDDDDDYAASDNEPLAVKKSTELPGDTQEQAQSPFTALKKSKDQSPLSVETPKKKSAKSKGESPQPSSTEKTPVVVSSAELVKKRGKAPSPRVSCQEQTQGQGSALPVTEMESDQPPKKKRGRPKGSGNANKTAAPSTAFVLRPKELNCLEQGFSCVYCVYAAPLRHQVRLHCYDKHTNHPACLMEFKVENQCFRSDGVIDFEYDQLEKRVEKRKGKADPSQAEDEKTSGDSNSKQDVTKQPSGAQAMEVDEHEGRNSTKKTDVRSEENVGHLSETDVKLEHDDKSTVDKQLMNGVEKERNMKVENDERVSVLQNGDNYLCNTNDSKMNKSDPLSPHSNPDMEVDELHISEIYENGKRYKSSRKQRKKFDNPLKTLVTKLHTGRIDLEDPFHGTLDEVDSILFQFGVRTLNMDMLTQQQFSNFISKFGADLQPA